eukprot:sb/3471717/
MSLHAIPTGFPSPLYSSSPTLAIPRSDDVDRGNAPLSPIRSCKEEDSFFALVSRKLEFGENDREFNKSENKIGLLTFIMDLDCSEDNTTAAIDSLETSSLEPSYLELEQTEKSSKRIVNATCSSLKDRYPNLFQSVQQEMSGVSDVSMKGRYPNLFSSSTSTRGSEGDTTVIMDLSSTG